MYVSNCRGIDIRMNISSGQLMPTLLHDPTVQKELVPPIHLVKGWFYCNYIDHLLIIGNKLVFACIIIISTYSVSLQLTGVLSAKIP